MNDETMKTSNSYTFLFKNIQMKRVSTSLVYNTQHNSYLYISGYGSRGQHEQDMYNESVSDVTR